MAKSFACRKTPEGVAVMEDTTEHLRQGFNRVEEQYGRHNPETWEARLILAVMHSAAEDYEKVESLLAGYWIAAKGKQGANPRELSWAHALLFETYFKLNRIPEAMRISNEARSLPKEIDPSASDPLLEAFLRRTMVLEAMGDLKSRQRRFVAALMTLCWYVSHGFHRSTADSHVRDQLQVLFKSYGVGDEEWEWTVKHAHLTRYDFVGLLSILLHHTGLAPRPLRVVARRRYRVIEVR
jgi:hypothetical protein